MVFVIASLQLQPGTRAGFLSEFARVVPLVRAEDGCLLYVPTLDAAGVLASQSPADENHVTVVEQWATVSALTAHDAAAHMQVFRTRVAGMVVQRSIRVLAPA